ncbi:MAG: O-antigen ligase family protein [Gaiellaceae bacterium]
MTVVELALYALLLAAAAVPVWRRPVAALYLFVARERRLPFRPAAADWLALGFAALAAVYALVPQSALGGQAGHRAVALALRHDVVPVGAYFLGRSLRLGRDDLRRLAWTLLGTAGFVAAVGLVDAYAVPIGWWRTNGVIDYFHKHLGYDYHGTGTKLEPSGATYGLPENFIYNVGGDKPFLRRLVSTFLSPLASGYLFVVALLVAAAVLRARKVVAGLALITAAGLLWTFSRSSLLALAVGLVVLAALRRRRVVLVAAVLTVAVAIGWAHLFPKIGPTGNWTRVDLVYQHRLAQAQQSRRAFTATSAGEPSLHEHWESLKDGVRTMIRHPQGYGLGNVGQTASRTNTPLKAGESNYTELGVELGVLGAVLWTAWGLALLAGLVRAGRGDRWAAGVAAAFAAILTLAVQTDVIGDPWVAYCVWALAGALMLRASPDG